MKTKRGRLSFYHPNGKGSGCAAQLELRLNEGEEERYDCFFLDMARQKSVSEQDGSTRRPASFDWAAKATVKLDFLDICEVVAVLEGIQDGAGGERQGLYHDSGEASTLIEFSKAPAAGGFQLGLSKKAKQGDVLFRGRMLLSPTEAIGLRCVLQAGLFHMTFQRALTP